MNKEKKPLCIICQSEYHYQSFCPYKKKSSIRKHGKEAQKWIATRADWFQKNATADGIYYCHYCGCAMTMTECTLDHKLPRGSHVSERYKLDNLVPCCFLHNSQKGSMTHDAYVAKYFPNHVCGSYGN